MTGKPLLWLLFSSSLPNRRVRSMRCRSWEATSNHATVLWIAASRCGEQLFVAILSVWMSADCSGVTFARRPRCCPADVGNGQREVEDLLAASASKYLFGSETLQST
ncbi:hypothetical protein DL98DRAFT_109707 [Cadophora sp. DSE1049]|nr:hypothetical protein DL98DRAFT_109707 [Cadophora sp. DSE1049]